MLISFSPRHFKIAVSAIATLASFTTFSSFADDQYVTAKALGLMEGFPPAIEKRVDKSNALFSGPYNRWSYLNMRTIYPTTGIDNADVAIAMPRHLDTAINELRVQKVDEAGKMTEQSVDMNTYFKETYTDAFVVVKGNQIVFEHYDNGMDANHPHLMMSVTKSFAGLLGLMAVENGQATEEDKVSSQLPELKTSGAFKDATFGQVLNMTNAMDFSEDYADPNSGIVQYGIVLGLMEPEEGKTYANSIYEFLPSLPRDMNHNHGDIFHYQTPKTDVVNWYTNRVTGQSFQKSLSDKLWSKLGTDGETYVLLDKNGTLFAGGGLNATPTDLARFATMMLNNGQFNGEQVVAKSIVDTLAKGGNIDAFSNGTEAHGPMANGDWSYRAQWWVRHTAGKESFNAIGVHGQWIYIDRERNIAIIKQSSQPVSANDYFDGYNINAFDAIIDHLSQ
ncbi:serine hydrolase domain-containing protein [Vibrio methylphosphonaticus]|uniref:serine hydrolase domain-containing protein n=1 Tax=Vibrio methylphosphonaticus TaxID=2946866 RepID=UPI00202A7747|nr:serine hydrolase [Vibrio methylphosphonaticus]MCL9774247.1 beta-lactamase family protein [Vibrio methylphosphonaticus]